MRKYAIKSISVFMVLFVITTSVFAISPAVSDYWHDSSYDDYDVEVGIDVSTFQGYIDWNAVKNAGIDFAIIRVGGRYSGSGNFYSDGRFAYNVSSAYEAGIKVGVYFFSQATTEAEAVEEADKAMSLMGDYRYYVTLPVYLDVEYIYDDGGAYGRLYEAGLSNYEQTQVVKAFCDRIAEYGMDAGVYAGLCSFDMDGSAIANAGYEVWHAQWYSHVTISPIYKTWQFSCHGYVDGVSGEVDLDFRYVPKAEETEEPETPKEPEGIFSDVLEDDWFYEYVKNVTEAGLFNGVGNNSFGPNNTMSREMFVTVLYRKAGEPEVVGTSVFSDVQDSEQWYYDAVTWATENGIVSGVEDGLFGVGRVLTRQQMVTLLYRYANYCGCDTTAQGNLEEFPDSGEIESWAADAMSWAVAEGIINGNAIADAVFLQPAEPTTRAQVAAVMTRLGF